jgi:hypothetical protein
MAKLSIGWYKLAVAMKPRLSSSNVRNADVHGESPREITMMNIFIPTTTIDKKEASRTSRGKILPCADLFHDMELIVG